jgi:uncharacterized protein with ParB-like and HNH nuclease domain
MKASETTLRNLLEGTKQFQIPLFQRPYSWTEDKWDTLWEDLMKLYNDEVEGSYFLGAIVTQSIPGTADGISPYLVIDGQQRLITLTILLAAMRDHLIAQKNQELAKELYNLYLTNPYKKHEEFYKVLPTQEDRDTYQTIVQDKDKDKNTKKEGQTQKCQIYESYNFFKKQLKNPNKDEDFTLDIAKFKGVILERLILVNITSDDKDNPYLIFESLNYKGQELTQADLVRNYIFMQLPRERREEIYQNKWLPLQDKFKANMDSQEYAGELTKAFWFYLRKDGKSVVEKEVYKEIKNRFDSAKNDSELKLEELVQFANYYQCLNFDNNEPQVSLRNWFKRLRRLEFTTCHIFLLNVYDEYEQKKLSLENFEKILRYLESYFVRRWFANVSTRSLGNVFNNLYREVTADNPDDLVEELRKVLGGYEKNKRWPSDEEFRQGILNTHVYAPSGSNDRVKLILESLADSLSKEQVIKEKLTIEHIMPQTLNSQWKSMLGANSADVHKQFLHTLGNLTLTAYNTEIGNKPFDEKKSIYLDSNVSLNKYFQDITIWNAQAIKERAQKLADIAIQVWPR